MEVVKVNVKKKMVAVMIVNEVMMLMKEGEDDGSAIGERTPRGGVNRCTS